MADISGYLNNIKSAESGETVRDSIIQCLNKINNDNPNKTKPLNVTANGTYTSETGYSYNPVTVNVPSGGPSGYTFEELEVTENGEYEPDEENKMFNKVNVNVPQFANELAPDGYTITQNGEYDPLLDGYDGYGKIIVNVNEATGDGPFKVEFYDKQVTDPTAAVIETQLVAKGGSAEFQGVKPTSPLGSFVGWSPSPTNVTRDLKCYPNFAQIIVDPTEIQDDWGVICANGGAPYPLGAHKILAYGASIPGSTMRNYISSWSQSNNYDISIVMMMYKVGEGEGNSHSSWLGTLVLLHDFGIDAQNWDVCNLRNFLNGPFFDNMTDIFKSSIVPVIKYSVTTPNGQDLVPTGSQDKIWVPNYSEIVSYQTGLDEVGVYDWVNSNTWPASVAASPRALQRAALTDTTSMKYIRDYLNNDRNFIFALGSTWDGTIINDDMIYIRDIWDAGRNMEAGYYLPDIGGGSRIPCERTVPWFRVPHMNIGFCL